jgi:hypothetical protein
MPSSVCNARLQGCPQTQSKIMKSRQLFIDVVKRTAGALTAAAIFFGPTGLTFAAPPNHKFRFNLAPLSARDADSAVNDLVDAFTQ